MYPETYIIQRGRIVRKVVGGIDWMSDDMGSFVRTQLAHQKSTGQVQAVVRSAILLFFVPQVAK